VKACWRICFKTSGFKDREKNRAKETIEAESLSCGRPADKIREVIERVCGADGGILVPVLAAGFAAFVAALCAAVAFDDVFFAAAFCADVSGAVTLPDVFCSCNQRLLLFIVTDSSVAMCVYSKLSPVYCPDCVLPLVGAFGAGSSAIFHAEAQRTPREEKKRVL
jgi:hypothetical protein